MKNAGKLSKDFRLTVPKALRNKMGWKPGQKFVLLQTPGGVMLDPIAVSDNHRGMAHRAKTKRSRDKDDL